MRIWGWKSNNMKMHIFPFTVAYADTDAEGVMYHARYLEVAERARMSWLRGHVVADGDIGFVVRELNIKYMMPLCLGDDFVVETQMTDVGAAIVRVEQKIIKGDDICAIINLKVAYLGKNMRPKRIPSEFLDSLI